MRSYSFDGDVVTFSGASAAHAEFAVAHQLERPPSDAFVLDRTSAARLYRGRTQWTDTTAYFRSNVAGAGFTVLLFGQEARAVAVVKLPVEVMAPMENVTGVSNEFWPDAVTREATFHFPVPLDYLSGDIDFAVFRRGAAAGTAVMTYDTLRFRDATAPSAIASGTAINFIPGDTNSHTLTVTIGAANFASGDILRLDITRTGGDGGDSMAASVFCDGAWATYQTA